MNGPASSTGGASASRVETLDLLWGAPEISEFIGKSRRLTYHLLEQNKIPARKVGATWVASKANLKAFFDEVGK